MVKQTASSSIGWIPLDLSRDAHISRLNVARSKDGDKN